MTTIYSPPVCRYCSRRVDGHCDRCRGCWHYGLDHLGRRELGCCIHDVRPTAPFRWTTFEVAR